MSHSINQSINQPRSPPPPTSLSPAGWSYRYAIFHTVEENFPLSGRGGIRAEGQAYSDARLTFFDCSLICVDVWRLSNFRRLSSKSDFRWFFVDVRRRSIFVHFSMMRVAVRFSFVFRPVFRLSIFVAFWYIFVDVRYSLMFRWDASTWNVRCFFLRFSSSFDARPFFEKSRRRSMFVTFTSICVDVRFSRCLLTF